MVGNSRLVAAGMVAALVVGAAGGCRRSSATSASPDGGRAVASGAASCDSVLPAAGAARLPVLHRRDRPDADDFAATAAAFPGDARVGPAAWWIRPVTWGTIKFAGPDRLVVAGQSGTSSWAVGGVSVRDPAQRWARESGVELPVVGSFVDVPDPVVVGTTVVTSVPQRVRRGDSTRTVVLVCGFDAADGHVRWGTEVQAPEKTVTLLATGGSVVVQFDRDATDGAAGDVVTDLVALTAETGRMRWHTTVGVPATVTASGGLLVLSPGYNGNGALASDGLTEIRVLDPADGHVAWRHPVSPLIDPNYSRIVVATAAGRPEVIAESVEKADVTTGARQAQLIAYGMDGSVRWTQALAGPGRVGVADDLLVETPDNAAPYGMTARRVGDGAVVWRARLNPSFGDVATSGDRLFVAAGDLRSLLVVDRHGGAVATSLAGIKVNVGKSGEPPGLAVADRTLMVTVGGVAVGFGLR